MDPTFFSILVALALGLAGWGVCQLVLSLVKGEKRRLHQRLSGEQKQQRNPSEKSILVAQAEQTGLSSQLTRSAFFDRLQRKLAHVYPNTSLVKFLIVCGSIGLVLAVVVFVFSELMLVAATVGAASAYVPMMLVSKKAANRQQSFALQLPDALDFLSRILRAGHSLSTGLQMMGTELVEPLAGEFRKCYDQHSLGQPMEDCLKDMAGRVQSTDFSFFVTAVLIQRQTGGDLSGVLTNISNMVRGRIRLVQYVKAKTAEGRLTGYILVAFPMLMFFITYTINPKYGGDMINTSTGLKLLGTAVGLQMLGLVAIRKITTVRV